LKPLLILIEPFPLSSRLEGFVKALLFECALYPFDHQISESLNNLFQDQDDSECVSKPIEILLSKGDREECDIGVNELEGEVFGS
jgi:hypothetical protein